jgi:hypothetical protein
VSPPIPRLPEITGAWLGAVLSAGGRDVQVDAVEVTPIGFVHGGAFRLTPTYAAAQPDLPRNFLLQTSGDFGHRSECTFYASVRDRVEVPAPDCMLCEIDADTGESVILLADPAPVVVVDPLDGCDEERARVAAAAIAGLHAPTWCAPEWLRFPGLTAPLPDSAAARALGDAARAGGERIVERFGGRLTVEDTATLAGAMAAVSSWVSAVQGRYSLLHGDFRLEHLLFAPGGAAVRVTGWQTLTVGLPARDLACLAGTGLEPELRSTADHDLVTAYHSALVERGVTGYDLESCWHDYRYAMLQAVLSCVSALTESTSGGRAADPMLAMLHRACVAVRDLGTLELVAEVDAAERAVAQYLTHVNVH